MRVAIMLYSQGSPERLRSLAKALSEGLVSQGHHVDIVDMRLGDDVRPAMYDYLCIGTQGVSPINGKIDANIKRKLDGLNGLSGKRSFAFVPKKLAFGERVLTRLMKVMESQGLYLRNSAIFSSTAEASRIGATLEISRKS